MWTRLNRHEGCSEVEEEPDRLQSCRTWRFRHPRLFGLTGSLLGVFVVMLLLTVFPFAAFSLGKSIMVLELFESPEAHDIATNQLMEVHKQCGDLADRNEVRTSVQSGFQRMGRRLLEAKPELARVRLQTAEKDGLLHMLRFLSDRRLQRLGLHVANTVERSRCASEGCLQAEIERELQEHAPKLRRLYEEVVPEAVRAPHPWSRLLHPKRIRIMRSFGVRWHDLISDPLSAQPLRRRLKESSSRRSTRQKKPLLSPREVDEAVAFVEQAEKFVHYLDKHPRPEQHSTSSQVWFRSGTPRE
mmetsp:Transcript_41063/g.89714  ORF Transcript_41063/g.89714 Transcript_41063/m.89714 type:complete len:301 (-) Transcript_41063:301-1203(-)